MIEVARPSAPSSTSPPSASLLRSSLQRAAARIDANEPVLGPPDVPIAAVLSLPVLCQGDPQALRPAIAAAAELTGLSDQRLLATWISGWIVHWVLGPALVAWFDERRVPSLDPDEVAIWWAHESGAHVRLGTGRWAVLPEDPLATVADVDVVAHPLMLASVFHDRIVALLEPFFHSLHLAGRVGLRQQWLQARDRVAGILQEAGRAVGREEAAIGAARALIDRAGSPLRAGRGGFERYEVDRQLAVVYHRATCCLALRAPDGRPCLTCPARPSQASREAVLARLETGATSPV